MFIASEKMLYFRLDTGFDAGDKVSIWVHLEITVLNTQFFSGSAFLS